MDEKAHSTVGAQLAAPPQSQLDRFANELEQQNELLSLLEGKLDVVSERSPQKDVSEPSDRVHISTLINLLGRNNRRLRQIIDEIVL